MHLVESPSRSILLFEYELFGKPLSTFLDHALAAREFCVKAAWTSIHLNVWDDVVATAARLFRGRGNRPKTVQLNSLSGSRLGGVVRPAAYTSKVRMNDHTIVALLATRGVEDFLQNALLGLAGAGINPRIVHVARPDSAGDAIDPVIRAAGAHVVSFSRFCDPSPDFTSEGYVEYGTPAFISINWAKVRYLRWLLQQYRQVVYADVDVAWLADPLWYLQAVGRHYPLAFQTEAVRRFPPVCCWGFVSLMATDDAQRLLNELLAGHDNRPPGAEPLDEQAACEALFTQDPGWMSRVYPLPEALFLNGLSYRGLLPPPAAAVPMHGALTPFAFHANWTAGLENKRALMMQTGTWLLK